MNRASGYATTANLDANGRLGSLTNAASGASNAITLLYSAADQIKSRTQSNAVYAVAGPAAAGTTSYGVNGLNQITNVNGGAAFAYDGRGNLTGDGSGASYSYNVNNLLTSTIQGGIASTMAYDAENRLYSVTKSGVTTKFLYDGTDLIAEYNGSNALLRRYVHGPGADNALAWYEGATTSSKYYLYSDERGSVTAVTSSAGVVNTVYGYNEYGVPSTLSGSLSSRFRYTGQIWLPEVGLYYYKARMYAPSLGRFLQTDPIGYGDGMNMYAYVHNDPMNATDPSGTKTCVPIYFNRIYYNPNTGDIDKGSSFSMHIGDICFPDGTDFANMSNQAYEKITNSARRAAKAVIKAVEKDYSKCGGELGARGPDFGSVNFSVALPWLFSYDMGAAVDRHGAVYGGNGFSFNKKPVGGVSGSAMANYMVDNGKTFQTTAPSRSQLSNFLTGSSWSVTGGDVVGGNFSFNDNGSSVGGGLAAGASFSRTNFAPTPLFQLNPNHCKVP